MSPNTPFGITIKVMPTNKRAISPKPRRQRLNKIRADNDEKEKQKGKRLKKFIFPTIIPTRITKRGEWRQYHIPGVHLVPENEFDYLHVGMTIVNHNF